MGMGLALMKGLGGGECPRLLLVTGKEIQTILLTIFCVGTFGSLESW